ncbi:hypothetical protein ETD86_12935 [Nonomuraea turkmeniaca]|uniref:Uncharacterized protein n=1 Tax=Nonomuraea turkmeniaca TaxID=103838 RepID=A0A5S4FMW2_9ACTN|nr:hypothetical protein [Nonomuraea turkmeniaca]TMR22067.1 hypothetical protein ETD86_12935 [Nonomuraea turkmeniaca]
MGISYTYEGEFAFDIPVPLSMIPTDSPHLPTNYDHSAIVFDHPVNLLFDLDDSLGETVAVSLVPAAPELARDMGNIEKELRAIMDAYPGHGLSGELVMKGDDLGAVTTVTLFGGEITFEDEDDEDERLGDE